MADPFSIGASTAGLVSLGLTVFSAILKYYSAYKDQDSDVSSMCISLINLEKTFIVLNRKIEQSSVDPECVSLVKSSINNCENGICGLRVKLDKIRRTKPASLDQLKRVDINIAKVQYDQTQAALRQLEVEERNVLTLLSPLEFYSKQNDSLSRHQAGTGRWLFDSTEFGAWVDGDLRVLWCPGMRE
ncbi:MAG: hypothetical protein Q9182_004873 [Xanthomendoza sp. 2 TL-2023]